MSTSSRPTIPLVLPLYGVMEKHLVKSMSDYRLPQDVQRAASAANTKLKKYKDLAIGNQYYIIGTILHPNSRATWFKTTAPPNSQKEQTEAVEKATTLFTHVAEAYYMNSPWTSDVDSHTPQKSAGATENSWLADMCSFDSYVSDIPATTVESWKDEVGRYLGFEGGTCDMSDPLSWWKHCHSFPMLARMARDFLVIPATSVSVERVFSKSRHICSDLRSSLKAEAISKALLAKVWIRDGLLAINPPVEKKKHGDVGNT